MGYPEKSFVFPHQAGQTLPDAATKTSAEPADAASRGSEERTQSWLTAAIFLGLAAMSWLAGLHIAPVACIVLVVAVLAGDIASRAGGPH